MIDEGRTETETAAMLEIRRRLVVWMRWHWGDPLGGDRQNFIGAMMARAEGDLGGNDLTVPRELTPQLEAVEKAVARMRGTYDLYREIIVDTYVRGMFTHELAGAWSDYLRRRREWSPTYAKQMLARSELICGRLIRDLDREIAGRDLP